MSHLTASVMRPPCIWSQRVLTSPSSEVGSGTSVSIPPTTMRRPIWRPSEKRFNGSTLHPEPADHRHGGAIPACSPGSIHFNGSKNNVKETKLYRRAATVVAALLHIMDSW